LNNVFIFLEKIKIYNKMKRLVRRILKKSVSNVKRSRGRSRVKRDGKSRCKSGEMEKVGVKEM
jgi:hypothetical protein